MTKNLQTRAERRRATIVERAADAGATGSTRISSDRTSHRRFLAIVASVVVVGTLLVGYTWNERQYEHPTTIDSWQSAYGVFDCQVESWLDPFESTANPDGIRSRGDGVIYIEPASDAVAGDNATLDVFFDAMGAQLTDDTLTLPNGTALAEAGTFCGTEEAVLQVQRWQPGLEDPVETRYVDLADTNFLVDGESFAIVFAPAGATVPAPPSTADLPALAAN